VRKASLFIWGMVAGAIVFGLSVKLIFTAPRQGAESPPTASEEPAVQFASYSDVDESRVTAIVRAAESVGDAVVSVGVIKHRMVRPSVRSPFSDQMLMRPVIFSPMST